MGSVDFMAEAPTIFALKLFAVISPVKVREEAPVNSTFSNADRLTSAVNLSLFFPLILPSKVMSSIPSCFSVKFSCFSSRAGMVTDAPVSGGNFECPVDFNPGDFFSLETGNRDLFLRDGSGDGEAEHEEDECNFFHDYYFLMGRLKVVKSYKG